MKKFISSILAISVVLAMTLTGCSSSEPAAPDAAGETPASEAASDAGSGEVIKIGIMQPLTGANAGGGVLEKVGSELANELYPEVNGKKIQLVALDNKSDKVEAATVATRLVENEKVSAIIGSWGSSLSMAAGPIIKDAQIPTVSCSATNPLVTEGNEFYFRVCFIDPFQGTVMSNYAYNNLGARKVAIIKEVSGDYAVGLAKFFTDNWIALSGDASTIVAEANYNTGDQDFSAQLTTVNATNPDVIFAPGNFTETALMIKQARQLGITIPFIGGDAWETPDFLSIGGADVEGATFSSFFDPENPITDETTTFIDAYKAKYNEEPPTYAALGYDAYLIIYKAMEKCGSNDPIEIQKALTEMSGFQGATGVVSFDENRNAIKSAVIKTVKDGKYTFLDIVEP